MIRAKILGKLGKLMGLEYILSVRGKEGVLTHIRAEDSSLVYIAGGILMSIKEGREDVYEALRNAVILGLKTEEEGSEQ